MKRRTGHRAPGRPRGPVSADGRLTAARKILPHIQAFPEMRRAVDRVMAVPNEVVVRGDAADPRDVNVEHRYTPAERGQALAFVWWVFANRSTWSRAKLRAAVQAVSPLMLFPSPFLAEVTGLPRSTVQNHMLRPPGLLVSRVTGSCDPWVVHRLLESSTQSLPAFRAAVREVVLLGDAPKAMVARLSGVPVRALLRPERGVQFFPEAIDRLVGRVCAPEAVEGMKGGGSGFTPAPGPQAEVRRAFAGARVDGMALTSVPVPEEGGRPYYACIPGLPRLSDVERLGPAFYDRLRAWEDRYRLPARIFDN